MHLSVKKATADSVSRWLQKYLDMTNILQYPEEEFARFDFWFADPNDTISAINLFKQLKRTLESKLSNFKIFENC